MSKLNYLIPSEEYGSDYSPTSEWSNGGGDYYFAGYGCGIDDSDCRYGQGFGGLDGSGHGYGQSPGNGFANGSGKGVIPLGVRA
jgi:hypothetical protein